MNPAPILFAVAAQTAPAVVTQGTPIELALVAGLVGTIVVVVVWAVRLEGKVAQLVETMRAHVEADQREHEDLPGFMRESMADRLSLRAEMDKIETVAHLDAEHRQRQLDELKNVVSRMADDVSESMERVQVEQRKALHDIRNWLFTNVALTASGKTRRAPGPVPGMKMPGADDEDNH